MTIFNFINARVINDRINPFKGIFTDRLFMAIVIMIMIIQILLVVFGGATFNCYYWVLIIYYIFKGTLLWTTLYLMALSVRVWDWWDVDLFIP